MRFYGREEEIALLQDCWTVVLTNQVAQMVTVMGRPRVGKTEPSCICMGKKIQPLHGYA